MPKADQIDGALRFDVGALTKPDKNPSIHAYGITSQIAGTHVHEVVADDIEQKDNASTVEAREKLLLKVSEFSSIIHPGGRITYLGTPHHIDSIYNHLAKRGYVVRRWPARFPNPEAEEECLNVSPWIIDRLRDESDVEAYSGAPTNPERFPDDVLLEKLADIGPSEFSLQFLLDTSLSDENRYPLKLRDLVVMPVHVEKAPLNIVWGTSKSVQDIPSVGFGKDKFYEPIFFDTEYGEYRDRVMFIDPSGRGKDQTGYAVVFELNGMLFVPDAGGLAGGYDPPTLTHLAKIAQQWNVRLIKVEGNFGDGMYTQLLAPHVADICGSVGIEEVHSTGQKELRIIDTLEPVMASHRLVVDPRVARNQTLMGQLVHITRDRGSLKHDDQIEALAGGVAHHVEKMRSDVAKAADAEKHRRKAQVAKDFIEGYKKRGVAMHIKQPPPSRKPSRRRLFGWSRW